MESLAVLLLIGGGIAAYLAIVWAVTASRAIRRFAVLAVIASVVLGLASTFYTLCGIAENRSELFYERCEGSVPYMPLYAVPLLLAAPVLRRFISGGLLLMMIAVVVVVAIAIPKQLFDV
jgi:hypothetical protein